MWGAHCGVLWPKPSSTSLGGQARRAPRQTPGSLATDRNSQWQCGIGLTAEVSPTLVEYLGLTRTQAKAIQKLMDCERPTTEPLMDELQTVSAALGVAIRQNQSNESAGVAQSLAATQARLLKQLMRANSRLQRKIDEVLGRQQRKKLDALRHRAEVSVVHGS